MFLITNYFILIKEIIVLIYDILPVNNYQGNGSSIVFDFDFYIDNASQLKVYLFDTDGTKRLLQNEVDYSLEGEKNHNGGFITFPLEDSNYAILSDGQKLSLELDIPVSQETQYNNSSLLNLETLEYSFDYLTRLIQILKRKLSLCVKVEECSENTPEELIKLINEANISTDLYAKQAQKQYELTCIAANNAKESKDVAEKISQDVSDFYDGFIKNGMYKFNLFDTKISDHILEGNEAKGWALQGTYVTKDLYPDFYSKCLEQKNNAIESQVTLGSSTLTMFVNSNGHQFYNIVDKSIVDTFYNSNGIADFYGIDEENERVFLPRNKWFAIKNPPSTVPVYGNGMALGIYDGTNAFGLGAHVVVNGQPSVLTPYAKNYGTAVGSTRGDYTTTTRNDDVSWGVTNDPSKSGLIAKTSNVIQTNENKYLYYCVGNTVVNDAQIDVGGLVSQMELKANATLDNILPQGKSLASFWAMPSNKIVNLTLGASAASYTAPANGWFYLTNNSGGSNPLSLRNSTVGFHVSVPNGASGHAPAVIIPAKKGDRVAATYVQPSGSTTKISFIYAEGDK